MGIMSTLFGPGSDDINGLANDVYDPNTGAYSNAQSGQALAGLANVNAGQGALNTNLAGLANANYGASGLTAQQNALNAITNMAAGRGPSLAGANLQAGLNTTFQNLSNQAMSNQGNVGAGNSQRNLLNAQAAAANNVSQQAGLASVAEQMGALQQQDAAAQGLTSGQLAQGNFRRGVMQDQAGVLRDQAGNALNRYNMGQTDTQNAMQLDAAKKAAADQRLGIHQQALNADHQRFTNALDSIGKVVNIGASIGSTIATGGLNQVAGAGMGAAQGAAQGATASGIPTGGQDFSKPLWDPNDPNGAFNYRANALNAQANRSYYGT